MRAGRDGVWTLLRSACAVPMTLWREVHRALQIIRPPACGAASAPRAPRAAPDTHLHTQRARARAGRPVIAVELKHIAMRWVQWLPTVDETAEARGAGSAQCMRPASPCPLRTGVSPTAPGSVQLPQDFAGGPQQRAPALWRPFSSAPQTLCPPARAHTHTHTHRWWTLSWRSRAPAPRASSPIRTAPPSRRGCCRGAPAASAHAATGRPAFHSSSLPSSLLALPLPPSAAAAAVLP